MLYYFSVLFWDDFNLIYNENKNKIKAFKKLLIDSGRDLSGITHLLCNDNIFHVRFKNKDILIKIGDDNIENELSKHLNYDGSKILEDIRSSNLFYEGIVPFKNKNNIHNRTLSASLESLVRHLPKPSKAINIIEFSILKNTDNAEILRELGYRVYSYNPVYGKKNEDGWKGCTKAIPPNMKFSHSYTTFLMDSIPHNTETKIINILKSLSLEQIHITRNLDIYEVASNFILKTTSNNFIKDFFFRDFLGEHKLSISKSDINEELVLELCYYGFPGYENFNRIPKLEKNGAILIKKTANWKLYQIQKDN